MYDIIVVGGGIAGMTAALYGLRAAKSVLVIEKGGFGGQITYSPKVENFPGTLSMSGNELADKMLDQIMSHGAELEFDTVTSVEDMGNYKRVHTEDDGVFEGKSVILATGVKHRMLGLEGEYDLVGNGISFCAVCDGDFYSGQRVVVVGGGNSALQEATLLAKVCSEVIIVQNLDNFTGEETLANELVALPNVTAVMGTCVEELITEEGELKGIKLHRESDGHESVIYCDGLFVAVGLIPENESFANIVTLNEFGYIASGEDCLTATNGIYAAGDCRSKTVRQLTTAAADGSVAALAACRYVDSLN